MLKSIMITGGGVPRVTDVSDLDVARLNAQLIFFGTLGEGAQNSYQSLLGNGMHGHHGTSDKDPLSAQPNTSRLARTCVD